jgi:hypothetical protein
MINYISIKDKWFPDNNVISQEFEKDNNSILFMGVLFVIFVCVVFFYLKLKKD